MNSVEPPPSHLNLLPKSAVAHNLPTYVYSVLFEAILNGTLAPGERLLVDEVAEHFGASKIPVREALKALEVSGWVEIRPRRGTFVKRLSIEELHEIFEMRRVLEPYCARMAALRRSAGQLRELQQLVDEGIKAIRSGDVVRISGVNSRFHTVMAQAVGNQILGSTVTNLEFRMRRYFIAVDWQQRNESVHQHKAIFEAIRDQDAALAEQLTIQHLDHTEAVACRSVELNQPI